MKLYLAFLLAFAAAGMFWHHRGVWTYLAIAASTIMLAALYLVSARAWQ